MKNLKTLTLILSVTATSCLYAQNQESRSVTVELEFAPLGSEPLKINSLRGRYFLNESIAIRTSIFMGGNRNASISYNSDSTVTYTNTNGKFDFALRPGVEKHFALSSKLSSYVGGEFYYGYNSTRTANQTPNADNSVMTTRQIQASSSFGLNALSGTDFYFTEKFYLGVELGFGFIFKGRSVSKTKYKNPDPASNLVNTISKGNTTSLNWGPNYQGTIRIGYHIR